MNFGILGHIALTFGVLSLMSIGGANATVTEVHRQVVDVMHWMDDATFANVVAIGQAAPGPNVLIVSMVGWEVAGVLGLVVASLAIVVPSSLLALVVGRATTRYADVAWVGTLRDALAPVAVGFMLASGYVMSRAAYQGALSIALVAGGAAMLYLTRRSPLLAIFGGALLGILGHRLHAFA